MVADDYKAWCDKQWTGQFEAFVTAFLHILATQLSKNLYKQASVQWTNVPTHACHNPNLHAVVTVKPNALQPLWYLMDILLELQYDANTHREHCKQLVS